MASNDTNNNNKKNSIGLCIADGFKMILTCSPKIASWIHFNFCNFIPKLSQVETDCGGKRHERK